MLHAAGLSKDDLGKPQIGVVSMWYEGNPCNMHLNDLAVKIKKSIIGENMVGFQFTTIGVSDGISMGFERVGTIIIPSKHGWHVLLFAI